MQKSLSTGTIDFFINCVNGVTQSSLSGFLGTKCLSSFPPDYSDTSCINSQLTAQPIRLSLPRQSATNDAAVVETIARTAGSSRESSVLHNAMRYTGIESRRVWRLM